MSLRTSYPEMLGLKDQTKGQTQQGTTIFSFNLRFNYVSKKQRIVFQLIVSIRKCSNMIGCQQPLFMALLAVSRPSCPI